MPFKPTRPTHYCTDCGRALWEKSWPYALCKDCGKNPCKHGEKHGHCNQCDIESDIAYDSKFR